jgi:hypothetical protein
MLAQYGVVLTGVWSQDDKYAYYIAVRDVGKAFAESRRNDETAEEAFKAVFGTDDVVLTFGQSVNPGVCDNSPFTGGGCTRGSHLIDFISLSPVIPSFANRVRNVVHELGHAFRWLIIGRNADNNPATFVGDGSTYVLSRKNILHSDDYNYNNLDAFGRLRGDIWQFNPDSNSGSEMFSDMFVAYTYDTWNEEQSPIRDEAIQAMNTNMAEWTK